MARQRTRDKVHQAVLSLAKEGRVGAITMEGVAARAGVSKQTLYSSWTSTGAILFDALLARSVDDDGAVVLPDSGDLARDLEELATGMVAELSDPTQGPLLRAVTAEMQFDDTLAEEFRRLLLGPQMSAVSRRLGTSGVPAPDDVAEIFVGPILHRWLLRSRPFDAAWVSAHVARTLRAAGAV